MAEHYEGVWWDAMGALGITRPTADPHATGYVDDMVALIAELIDRGHAYVGGDGVYFAAESIDGYGLLARQPLESPAGRGPGGGRGGGGKAFPGRLRAVEAGQAGRAVVAFSVG